MGQSVSRQSLIEKINSNISTASNPAHRSAKRIAALDTLESICHVQKAGIGATCQTVLAEVHHLGKLLEITGSTNRRIARAAWRVLVTVSHTSNRDIKQAIGRRVLEDLMEELAEREMLATHDLRLIVQLAAHLSTEETCRQQLHRGVRKHAGGGVPELVALLNHTDSVVQMASLQALVALSEKRAIRQQIVQCDGLLATVGLSFVGTQFGVVRHFGLRLLANLTKEHDVRVRLGEQAVLYRLAQACRKAHGEFPRTMLLLVASVFSNFSQHDDFSAVQAEDTMGMLYHLVFSDEIDFVIQGIWGIANYLSDATMRREFIETDGVKLLFSVLGESGSEVQVWFEVSRAILNIASGGLKRAATTAEEEAARKEAAAAVAQSGATAGAEGDRTGTDDEKEFLIREGALEALVAIYSWCMGETRGGAQIEEIRTGPAEIDEVPPEEQGSVYDDQGEDIERSSRFLCMTVVTHALQHLTTFGFVCQMLCDLGGTKAVMQVLRADFDTEGQEHAAAVVGNMARHQEPCRVVVLEDDVVGTLVDLLKYSEHELVHLQASYALANIGRMSGHYQKLIIEGGGVTGLVMVLKRDCPERTARNVINALSMLSTNEAKFEMMQSGGLPNIIKFSYSKDPDLRLSCAIALRNLSEMSNDAHHLAMAREGALSALVRMLDEDNVKMNKQAAHGLATLTSRMESNKVALVEQDGLRVVARHLAADDDDLLVHVLSVLGNLGSVTGILTEMSKLGLIVRQLCYVLQMDKFPLTLQAMRCLVNSTQDEGDSMMVLSLVPAQVFVDMLESSNATLQRHAAHVVANLAVWQANWSHLRKCGIIKVLTKQMRSDNFDVVIQSVRCIAQLMQDRECAQDMERYSMVMVLAEVARKSVRVLDEQQENEGISSYVSTRNLRMQEQVMSAMRLLAKHPPEAVALVERYGCLEVFLRLLEVPSIEVRKETAGCLAQLTSVNTVCDRVVDEGGMDHIMVCLSTSVNITRELAEDVQGLRERLIMDSRLKEQFTGQRRSAGNTHDSGLSYEEREKLMSEMDQKNRFSAQNSVLQEYCLQCMFHFAQSMDSQRALLEAYDWDPFMAPLQLPEEYQALDCAVMASKACFTMLQCKMKLYRFMELQGVRYVLRALEYDDADVKYLAAEALGLLSNADQIAFQIAIEQEGGVKIIMRLTESPHKKIRAQAFHAVAQLCNNRELGSMFVAQNILVSISSYATKVKHQPNILVRLIQIVSSLADNEKNRWKVLERGGNTLLLKCIVHYDLDVARTAAAALAKLVSSTEMDLREGVTRNKMASNLLACVEQSPFPEALRDTLQTLALVTEREAYRERAASDGIVDVLLALGDDTERDARLRKRLLENAGRRQDEIADFRKKLEQDENRYQDDDAAEQAEGEEEEEREEEPEEVSNVAGLERGRASRDVFEALSAFALQTVNNFLLLPKTLDYVSNSTPTLQRILKAANPLGGPRRLFQATKALCQCLQRTECHERACQAGALSKLAFLSKTQNVDAKLQVAEGFKLLAASPKVRDYFVDDKCVSGIKLLSASKMREVQLACCNALRFLTQTKEVARLLAKARIMTELLALLDQENDTLKMDSTQAIQQLCPCFSEWITDPAPGADTDAVVAELGPSVGKAMAVFRLAQQRSVLGNSALHTLCQVLLVCPERLCTLIDATAVLDLKKTAQQRSRDSGKGVTYTGELGKSSCDLHAYIRAGGDVSGRLTAAEPRVHAARALCLMTGQTEGPGGGPRIAVLKALSVEDMVRHAANEANDTHDVRYLVLMLRMAGNCAQRPTQRHKLADDKSGLLKVLLDLTTHVSPFVTHAAFHCLGNIAEEPASHHRLLALCPIEHLATALVAFVQDTLDVETLSSARHQSPDLTKGMSRLFARLCHEITRFMANVADGGPSASRSLKEAQTALMSSLQRLPGHIPRVIKWNLHATLARLDGKEPPPVQGLQATFDSLVAAARDRIDSARVQKGVHALATLARDPGNHQELADAGAVDALLAALRNPIPEIFIKAVWALNFLLLGGERGGGGGYEEDAQRGATAKERERQADARCQRVAQMRALILADDCRGIVPAVRAATDAGQRVPEAGRNVACKLVTLLLRSSEGARALEKNSQPPLIVDYVMEGF